MTLLASMLASALRGARRPAKGWAVLTPKLGPVGFYKGRGVSATGRHTRKGECGEGMVKRERGEEAEAGTQCDGERGAAVTPPCFSSSPTGAYQILPEKRPAYVVPDLTGCELKPYVARGGKKG